MMDEFNKSWVSGYDIGFGWIIGLILLFVLVLLAVKFLNKSHRIYKPDTKIIMDILKERYASGEINKKEFEKKKRKSLGLNLN